MADAVEVDVVVVGGGVMGSAAAWQLAGRGLDVVLLERFAPGHVVGASHGASRLFRHTYTEPEYLDLVEEAGRLWRELEAASGVDVLTITGGVSHGPGVDPHLADALAARGIPFAWLTPEEAAERWPGLRFEGRVLHEPDTAGRLHADRAVGALQGAAIGSGAVVRHLVTVRRLEVTAAGDPSRPERTDRVRVVTDDGSVVARRVVVTVGAWSAGLLAGRPRVPRRPAPPGRWSSPRSSRRTSHSGPVPRPSRPGRASSTTSPPASGRAGRTGWPRPARGSRSGSTARVR